MFSQRSIPYPFHKPKEETAKALFSSLLLAWYQIHKRNLPWRETNDPYKIWLSEIILQQTRVSQGLPYYQQFVKKYPTIEALAQAKEEAVLRLWQGLGYYSRARNLHVCARSIVSDLDGRFPCSYEQLLSLRGVGQYTAAAVASIAFNEPVPVVDGNVYRVLARVFGVEEDIASAKGKSTFYTLAQSLVPLREAGSYNQAIMEFGALCCTPHNPKCLSCPLKNHCVAFHAGRQGTLPLKSRKVKMKRQYMHYLVIQFGDRVYMRRRNAAGIWGGLYDFYLMEENQSMDLDHLDDVLVGLIKRHALCTTKDPIPYKHLLTHRQLYVRFFRVQATKAFIEEAKPLLAQHNMKALKPSQVRDLPKPTLIDCFLKKHFCA